MKFGRVRTLPPREKRALEDRAAERNRVKRM